MQCERLTDEQVVERAQAGDGDAAEWLLRRYRRVVLCKSQSLFMRGTERDDMIQEGMIGLFKGIRDFRPDRDCSFRMFADLCITRQMITAVKGIGPDQLLLVFAKPLMMRDPENAGRSGRRHRTGGGGLGREIDPPGERTTEEIAVGRMEAREKLRLLQEVCTPYEWQVAKLFGEGKSYQEIDATIGSVGPHGRDGVKGTDNALVRVRRKIAKMGEEVMVGEVDAGHSRDPGMGHRLGGPQATEEERQEAQVNADA